VGLRAPDIRYVTTADGVQPAYWSMGSGPAVIIPHNLSWSHAVKEWKMKSMRDFISGLAATHTVVRYDPRMAGVSSYDAPSMATRFGCGRC
jgi:pimeloyl-ACP methyl ester carboxylesterase